MILKVYAAGFLVLFIDTALTYALLALARAKALSVVKVASVVVSTALESLTARNMVRVSQVL
jgi:hypothetical protein